MFVSLRLAAQICHNLCPPSVIIAQYTSANIEICLLIP